MNSVVDCFIWLVSFTITDTPTDKWKKLVSLAVYSLFVLVAILYSLKDFGKHAFTMQDLYN